MFALKEIDFDTIVNRFLIEWKANKEKNRIAITMTLQEQIEVLRLLEKMRTDDISL